MSAAKTRAAKASAPDLLVLAFEIIAETGWQGFSFTELAGRSGLAMAEIRAVFGGRRAVLDALAERLDQAMLATGPDDLEGLPPRDRVFELVMSRLEAMAPLRAGVCRLMTDARSDPGLIVMTACRLDRSLNWLQEAAGLAHTHRPSPLGKLRHKIQRRLLGAVYLQTLNVWSSDESPDLAKTMASLDKQLRRIESVAGLAPDDRTGGTGSTGETTTDAA